MDELTLGMRAQPAQNEEHVSDTTRIIVESVWMNFDREATNAVTQLRDSEKFEVLVSEEFSRVLHQIKAHAKHCSNLLLQKLIDWRQQQMLRVNPSIGGHPPSATQSLYAVAVNIIYVRSVLMVIKSHKINSDFARILQNQAFECFCDVIPLQRKSTFSQWANFGIFKGPNLPSFLSSLSPTKTKTKHRKRKREKWTFGNFYERRR